MAESEKSYEVIITEPAELRFFQEILEYLEKYFSSARVDEIVDDLFQFVSGLSVRPYRGTKELSLVNREEGFRFILFRETRVLEIKIIYHIDDSEGCVFVVDFFPTKMNPTKMGNARK